MMAKPKGLSGPQCCYCGRYIGINQDCKVVKGAGTYVGWRHPGCQKPTNLQVWNAKYAEAQDFMQALRTGNRGRLHPALWW